MNSFGSSRPTARRVSSRRCLTAWNAIDRVICRAIPSNTEVSPAAYHAPPPSPVLRVGFLDYGHAWRPSTPTHTAFPGRDHVSPSPLSVSLLVPQLRDTCSHLYSGGGIAGRTLAVALGHFAKNQGSNTAPPEVHLYESGPETTTIGAGISVWPRTWTVMHALGWHDDLSRATVQAVGGGQGGKDEFSECIHESSARSS